LSIAAFMNPVPSTLGRRFPLGLCCCLLDFGFIHETSNAVMFPLLNEALSWLVPCPCHDLAHLLAIPNLIAELCR